MLGIMPKDAIPTSRREEQHWTSFRSAVVCLQQKLGEQMSEDPPVDDAKCEQIQHCYIDDEERDDFSVSSDILGSDTQQPQLVSVQIQHGSSASSLHNNPQEEESTNNNNRNNNNNSNKNNSSTHRFDFSGLEEVNKSICSNNNTIEELMVSPLNAETNTSQTATVALSLAESQLAEMKLKLAMTESERDELEFELMKSKG
jgi:hypothetical protein